MTKKRPAIGTTPVKSRVPVDVTDATFKANPFPFYAQLRAASPVFLVKLPTKQHAWLITRYDDVLNVLKDERFAKDRQNPFAGFLGVLAGLSPLLLLQVILWLVEPISGLLMLIYVLWVVLYHIPWSYALWKLNLPEQEKVDGSTSS